jgi:hypothetical protein
MDVRNRFAVTFLPPLWVLGQSQPAGQPVRRESPAGIGPGLPYATGLSRRADEPADRRRYHRRPLLSSRPNALSFRNTQLLLGTSANPPAGLRRLSDKLIILRFITNSRFQTQPKADNDLKSGKRWNLQLNPFPFRGCSRCLTGLHASPIVPSHENEGNYRLPRLVFPPK